MCRIILTPSTPGESNWSTSDLSHNVFTYYILEALHIFEDADRDKNFELSVEEVFNYAQSKTTDYTASNPNLTTQHPQMYDGYSGELSLLMKFTFSTESNLPSGTTILTLDGKGYSLALPALIWAPDSAHSLEVPSLVDAGSGTRYAFTSWDDGDTSASRTISQGGAYTASYKMQYLLTIESAYGEPTGAGWYDAGSTAPIQVVSIEGATTKYIFTGWSGDYSGNTVTASITVNSPIAITANWRTDYLQLFLIIGGVVIIVVALILLTIWMRRKKTPAPVPAKETAPPPTTPRLCVSCGAEIEPEDTFCIKCGKPV